MRVTKLGGCVGLNETTWIKANPPTEIVEYVFHSAGGVKPETPNGWKELLKGSGLKDIVVKTYKVASLGQFVDDIKMIGFTQAVKACGRLFSLYFKSPVYRKTIKEMTIGARSTPRNVLEYYGYEIYVGGKTKEVASEHFI